MSCLCNILSSPFLCFCSGTFFDFTRDFFTLVNCYQTKFVAIILVLSVFFYAIFRLTDFASDAFDFSSSKMGWTCSAQRALRAHRAFRLWFSWNGFGDLYLWREGRFLEVEDTPTVDPPLLPTPALPPAALLPPPHCCQPPSLHISHPVHIPPPPPWLLTNNRSLKIHNFILIFTIFSSFL